MVAWNSTLVELGAVLDQRNKEGTQGQGKIAHKVDVPCSYRCLKKWQVITDKVQIVWLLSDLRIVQGRRQ